MKKFLIGFLTGSILFASVGVIAAVSYVANPVDFKILVNGEEFISDPPALEVEGRTYLPLRAIGDALGVPVNWNEELRQAEVGTSTNVTESKYKTYAESKHVIDFGAFCGAKELKEKEISNGNVTYYYDWDADTIDAETIASYFDLMKEDGYTIKKEKDTFYYGINFDDLDKNMFSMALVNDIVNLEFYIAVTIFD